MEIPDNTVAIEAAMKAVAGESASESEGGSAPQDSGNSNPEGSSAQPPVDPAQPSTPEPAPAAKTDADLSPAMLQLMQRERELYQREQEAKAAIKKAEEMKSLVDLAQKDPVSFASQHMPQDFYETWTQRILNGGKETSVEQQRRLEARIEAAERALHESSQSQKQKEERARVDQYLNNFEQVLAEDDSYEMVRTFPGVRDVAENVLNAQFQATGKVLTPAEIAETIRDSIVHSMYEQLSQTKTAQSIWEKILAAKKQDEKNPAGAASKPANTGSAPPQNLSNDLGGSIEQVLPPDLSFEEKLVRAARILKLPGDG
jgi:hypothetical protein